MRRPRKNAGFSQSDLAERCGTVPGNYFKIEGGSPGSRLETVMEICAALDLGRSSGVCFDTSVPRPKIASAHPETALLRSAHATRTFTDYM